MRVRWVLGSLVGYSLVSGCVVPTLLDCDDPARVNDSTARLETCLTAAGAKAHLDVLQDIADRNGGNRAAGTQGFQESLDYVAAEMEAAGYTVTFHDFTFARFTVLSPPLLAELDGDALVEGDEFLLANFSGAGDVTAPVTAVDLELGPNNNSTSACEATDFAGFPAGHIALVQRGTCLFNDKVQNAVDAGAVGVIMMNQGNTPQRSGVFAPSLAEGFTIPVVGTSTPVGEALAAQASEGLTMRVVADVAQLQVPSQNLIAESPGGRADQVVVVGAHLDSVPAGPGVNDNGSGSASILEVAQRLQGVETTHKLRFIWWGAEELGLLGSFDYIETLPQEERDKIALYLNFDMVGSPNFVREIYDGDGNILGEPGPAGSAAVEAVFNQFFFGRGLQTSVTGIFIPSDSTPFALADIPVGGLFTGANEEKTNQDALLFGGNPGEPRDACYHQDCDTTTNISDAVLEEMIDAIGFVTLSLAQDASAVVAQKGQALTSSSSLQARPRPVFSGCHADEHPVR